MRGRGHVRGRNGNHAECGPMQTTWRMRRLGAVLRHEGERNHNVYEVEALGSVGGDHVDCGVKATVNRG